MSIRAAWKIAEEILDREVEMWEPALTAQVLKSDQSLLGKRGKTPAQTLGAELRSHVNVFYRPRRGIYALRKRPLQIKIRNPGSDWHGTCRQVMDFLAQYEHGYSCSVHGQMGVEASVYWVGVRLAVWPQNQMACEITLTTSVDVPRWKRELERLTQEFLKANRIPAEVRLLTRSNGLIESWRTAMWLEHGG